MIRWNFEIQTFTEDYVFYYTVTGSPSPVLGKILLRKTAKALNARHLCSFEQHPMIILQLDIERDFLEG